MRISYISCLLLLFVGITTLGLTTAETESEQTLVVGELWGIATLDPAQDGVTTTEKALVTETLVGANPDMSLKPWLALSWEQIDDDTWEFELRDDVLFHDGQKMTAEDVEFSLERAAETNPNVQSMLKLEDIEAVSEYTVQIRTTEPNVILPATLHYPYMGIISPNSVDDDDEVETLIGTGPFMVEDFDEQTQELIVVKNEDWWGGDVKLDKITIKPITDPNTRTLALENGELDFTVEIPYNEVDYINNLDDLNVEIHEAGSIYQIDLNLDHEPLDDQRVRQALSYAINREEIVDYVLFDVGTPAVGPFKPGMAWTNEDLMAYEYNPEKVEDLFSQAGWEDHDGDGILDKDGEPLEIEIVTYPNRPGLPPMSEAIAGQLEQAGLKVDVEVLEWGAIDQKLKDGDWDALLISNHITMVPDPEYYLDFIYKTGGKLNYMGYSNPEVDDLLDQAAESLDMEDRYRNFRDVEAIVHQEVPTINVAYYGLVVAKWDYVKGYEFDPAGHDYRLSPEMYIE